jgi:hypothetical protein
MGYYVKKPIVIQAVRFGETSFDEMPDWLKQAFNMGFWRFDCEWDGTFCGFIVNTLEGEMTGGRGDYIIQGVEGELYPCHGDIFEKTYEKAKVVKNNG